MARANKRGSITGNDSPDRTATPQARAPVNSLGDNVADVLDRLLDRIVTNLGRPAADGRIFFPSGIGLIDLKVSVGSASAELKVSSGAGAALLEPGQPEIKAPESCREVGLFSAGNDLKKGDKVPNKPETDVSGAIKKKIKRTDPEFASLVENANAKIVFKDEEGTGADRMMTQSLSDRLDVLADAVADEWSNVSLRVTEAWDEDMEHTGDSLHYEGRAADLTVWPLDGKKLGRLGRLAVDAGFDWVWYENDAHIHVSVKA